MRAFASWHLGWALILQYAYRRTVVASNGMAAGNWVTVYPYEANRVNMTRDVPEYIRSCQLLR